jgi:hypothetical protein
MGIKNTPNLKKRFYCLELSYLGALNKKATDIFSQKKVKKKGKFTAQPQYPCFGQDLGDSAGAGNLPPQR